MNLETFPIFGLLNVLKLSKIFLPVLKGRGSSSLVVYKFYFDLKKKIAQLIKQINTSQEDEIRYIAQRYPIHVGKLLGHDNFYMLYSC